MDEVMALSEFELKRCKKKVGEYIEKRRSAEHVRNQFDLDFLIEGQRFRYPII
jgi:hypothetical protein